MGNTATLTRKGEEVQTARWVLALGQTDAASLEKWSDAQWQTRAREEQLEVPDDFTRGRIANMIRMNRRRAEDQQDVVYRPAVQNENRLF